MPSEYQFHITSAYSRETFPMERLAKYMYELAKLLGEHDSVHFCQIVEGSVVLKTTVDEHSRLRVLDRVRAVAEGRGPKDARKAFDELDDMLLHDHATGSLYGEAMPILIVFPGRARPKPLVFGPFSQDGVLDGQVVELNAKSDPCRVQLKDGEVLHTGLVASREMVHQLGRVFDGPTVRVHGTGKWLRLGDGTWKLQEFEVARFDILDDKPLSDVVAALRHVEGSTWGDLLDPIGALLKERRGDGDAH